MRIIMCDDNRLFLDVMSNLMKMYAEEVYNADVVSFYSGADLIEYCKNNNFDIIFMDIEVGKNNGLDMGKILKEINPKSLIIYMSGFDYYYKDMVNAEPFRFVEKEPSTENSIEKNLLDALDAAVIRLEGKDSFWYTHNKRKYNVLFTKIKCFYSSGRKIYIVTDEKIEQNYFYGKIDDVLAELEKVDKRFVRINHRVIANIMHTYYVSSKTVEINKKIYTIPAKYRENFFEKLGPYGKVRIK